MNVPLASAQIIGCDYGVKPRVMLMGNMDFPEMLRSEFIALTYGRIPEFGLLCDVPCLGMAFNNNDVARRCFSIFKGWADESQDGDALSLSFVEFENGENAFCVYPEMDRLVRRMVPERHREEIEPLLFVAGHLKMFPHRSDGYIQFRAAAERSPFVLFPVIRSGPLMELAFIKRNIRFLKETELSENSLEGSLVASRSADLRQTPHPIPAEAKMTRDDVSGRRRRQLSRFFPVTLERLRLGSDFAAICCDLEAKGFLRWQVEQASCTVLLRHRLPDLFRASQMNEQKEPSKLDILDFLLSHQEDVMAPPITITALSLPELLEQIAADSAELLSYFVNKSECTDSACLQAELSKHDLMRG